MVIKKCIICGNEFDARGTTKCCSLECSKINRKNKMREYNLSDRGKANKKRYRQSEKGKATEKKWRQSDKAKAIQQRQNKSYKNKVRQKRYRQKKIAELNEKYDGDLDFILNDCPNTWMVREAKMRVWFNESYADGVIAKIKSTPACEVTGEKTNDLVIHHLYSFNTHPELGNDLANMVRISKEVHKEFHSIYGYGNNTPEQWMEFIEKQYGGD